MQCPRCNGLIIKPTFYDDDDDPKCSSCSRLFPHLKPATPEPNGRGRGQGLRDTIRYTGSLESLKDTTCIVHYKPHPSPSVPYPLLEVSCPWCDGVAEVKDASTNPAAKGYRQMKSRYESRKGFSMEPHTSRTGGAYVKCSTGHSFRLKISSEGIYSWE